MAWSIEPLGEDGALLRLGDGIDTGINHHVHALADRIAAQRPVWLLDIVPAFASLALFADPHADGGAVQPGFERIRAWFDATRLQATHIATGVNSDIVRIDVCYEGESAPDLASIAERSGLTPDEVVARHCAATYTVAMIGFAPGFPYLLGLDPVLATPRHASPRTRVPAGSVAIGGAQTGIYPRESPGGWHLIGRTPQALFDPIRPSPSLLQPGQRVRFVPIDAATFAQAMHAQGRAP